MRKFLRNLLRRNVNVASRLAPYCKIETPAKPDSLSVLDSFGLLSQP